LDGLDEVAAIWRSACVQAIDDYQKKHPDTCLVICSRIEEYFIQKQRFDFQCAVAIQPLSSEQIETYLSSAAGRLEAIRGALRTNLALYNFVKTPLLLSILIVAYQGNVLDDLQRANSHEALLRCLYDTYV